MSTLDMYKYVHGETYTASKIAQPVSGTGFVDIVGSDGVTPIAYTAIKLFDDAVGTTELVIDVDFEVGSADARYTALEASTVYRQVRILNATYQSAVFYADFSAVGGYVSRETFLDGDNTYTGDNTYSGSATFSGVFTASASAIFSGNVSVTGSAVFTGATPQVASAWVNFNGTGTPAIRDDYNVDSISDGGTGLYTVNIDVDLKNANYCISTTSSGDGVAGAILYEANSGANRSSASVSAIALACVRVDTDALADRASVNVHIFGGV